MSELAFTQICFFSLLIANVIYSVAYTRLKRAHDIRLNHDEVASLQQQVVALKSIQKKILDNCDRLQQENANHKRDLIRLRNQ